MDSITDMAQHKESVLALSRKYGEPIKHNPHKDSILSTAYIGLERNAIETQYFVPDQQNIIVVQYAKKANNVLRVLYYDRSLSKQEHNEITTFEQYLKTRYRQQDENRM